MKTFTKIYGDKERRTCPKSRLPHWLPSSGFWNILPGIKFRGEIAILKSEICRSAKLQNIKVECSKTIETKYNVFK
jgi:hypothetical protein